MVSGIRVDWRRDFIRSYSLLANTHWPAQTRGTTVPRAEALGQSLSQRPQSRPRHQFGAPLTFILMAVTRSTGPVMTNVFPSRPANVLLVAAEPKEILRMLFPFGSNASTPSPLLM